MEPLVVVEVEHKSIDFSEDEELEDEESSQQVAWKIIVLQGDPFKQSYEGFYA